jgi:predicted nucleic acid-binding protein
LILIVDASVAIKWFVREVLHDEALVLLDHPDRLQAPELIVPELTNAAWKKCLREEITRKQAQMIVAAVPRYVSVLYSISLDHERALEIALLLKHPVYDCVYLACAERVGGIVVTTDRVLLRRVKNSPFAGLAAFLPDWVAAEGA